MKKYLLHLLLLAAFVFPNLSANGQILTPVKWRTSMEPVKDKPGQYTLTFDATLDPGWHIYSMKPVKDGPEPTLINFDDSTKVKFIKTTESGAHVDEGFDKMFEAVIKQFSGTARFSVQICVVDDGKPIKGSLTYQTCSTVCIMGDPVPFSYQLAKGDCGKPNKEVKLVPHDTPGTTVPDTSHHGTIDTANTTTASTTVTPTANSGGICYNKDLVLDSLNMDKPALDCVAKQVEANSSIWLIFLYGFLGGLAALITPCVFPMIPLTVSFFIKGQNKGRKGIFKAGFYSFSIFIIYIILSIPFHIFDKLDPGVLSDISTNPWLNVMFFIIFVVFAISFFGYYEIGLPSGLGDKVDSASDIGGLLGIFLMALTLCIVSFSCTGPILGSLLGLIAKNGAWGLTAGMAGFGVALALPFGLFAAFPSWLNSLPKSGSWLNTVKVAIGFVELAFALKFLSNADLVSHWGLLKREVFFGIWILIGVVFTAYLFQIFRFPHDSPKGKTSKRRLATAFLVLAFTAYLIPGLTNTKYAKLSLLSGFPPPEYYSIYPRKTQCPLDIDCHKNDFCSALAEARKQNKPIFVDFTGYACVNCRQNEEHVWPTPGVFEKLNNDYVVVSLYVDDKAALPESEQVTITETNGGMRKLRTVAEKWTYFQRRNFISNSQPQYALLSPDGKLLTNPTGGLQKPADFKEFLECGLKAFKQVKGK